MIRLLIISILLFSCEPDVTGSSDENYDFQGITETDSSGNIIGNIDIHDWCEFDMDVTNSGFGLNPIYPNPISAQEWGAFGNAYQFCYQYSTPYDSTWSNFNTISINIVGINQDTLYTLVDEYANGQAGGCVTIADSLVADSMYRMNMISDDFECGGDIQFNQ